MTITRSQFEKLTEHLVERCRGPVMKAFKDAGYKADEIDEVVLVGGMTRVKDVMASDDVQAIRRAIDDLQAAAQAIAQTRTPADGGGRCRRVGRRQRPPRRSTQGQDDVIDAEFEVKK